MLVVSRKADEGLTLFVGEDMTPIHVQVVQINTGQIRIGVDAPDEVMIMRDELVEEVRAANRDALGVAPPERRRRAR